ncbi:hypothetical protein SAMN05192558_12077 [Actinokineospora alba]|uniref:Uncharacterized protein n=1 Tax=Actinokineospora alba TaxID=504798 RepID=A0A1H0WEC2_9PSEU|nr:hypothetical protein C8E96_4499 [Actinokineospora alba]SDI75450.1 hypothetical protein SAMN05421871_107202 [Actinokineospora alba]SDP89139.1 hypothetical protein SAMN05192558_12077 [Actinokineospora alba]
MPVSGVVTESPPPDLVRHVAESTGLTPGVAARVVADVIGYFGETTEDYVRRRHAELRGKQYRNAQIWTALAAELAARPVAPPRLTERQLRRIVYG